MSNTASWLVYVNFAITIIAYVLIVFLARAISSLSKLVAVLIELQSSIGVALLGDEPAVPESNDE